MIKKLRLRFMLVMVAIFTVIIFSVASGIFLLMLHSENDESEAIMKNILAADYFRASADTVRQPDAPMLPDEKHTMPPDKAFENDFYKKMPFGKNFGSMNSAMRSWILVDVDSSFQAKHIFRSMNREESTDDDAQQRTNEEAALKAAAEELCVKGNTAGKITVNGVEYRFMLKDSPDVNTYKRVVLLDRSIELTTLYRLAMVIGITALSAVCVVLVLSFFLSGWAVKPIENAWRQQKEFFANASHELKTPLTVISANTDVIMSNRSDSVADQQKWFGYIKDEISKMSKLVGDMLYIAREERDEEKIIMSEFDASETVEGACLVFEALIYENGKSLETDIEQGVRCKGDKERITQLAHILIDNAVKHSTESAVIKVGLHRYKGGRVKFTVENDGVPIPQEDLPHIFERFYRTDKSRTENTGGFGLGLSIAKMIIDKHKGALTASSSADGKTKFTAIW